ITRMTWAQQRNEIMHRGPFGAQSIGGGVPLWVVSIQADRVPELESGIWKALLMKTKGATNQIAVYDRKRPVPLGTMRGILSLDGAHPQGHATLTLTGGAGQAGKTLLAGDMLGVGSGSTQQVSMV